MALQLAVHEDSGHLKFFPKGKHTHRLDPRFASYLLERNLLAQLVSMPTSS